MSLIIYNTCFNSNPNEAKTYGIKQIDTTIFKKLMYNQIHKQCRFSIPIENIKNIKNILKEFENISIDWDKLKQNKQILNNEEINHLDINVNTDLNFPNSPNFIDVLFMGELNESQLKSYLEIYQEESDNLNEFVEFLSIVTFNQINPDRFEVKKKFNQLLNSFSEYWENPYNCNYTLTDKFNKRKFNNINYNGFDFGVIKNINSNFEIGRNMREINYLNDIIKFNDWKEMCITKYYVPSTKTEFNNGDIVQIYSLLPSEYLKYMFVSNMLCSRTYCHLILNNKEFLEISRPLFNKYKLIFKYLIGYAWITLKNEEYHIYHKMTDTDRIIFDIDTAELLPIYPFSFDDINQNPYACLLIDKDIMDIKKNCLTLEMMRDYLKYYGVCNSKEFERRLNIFVNGTNKSGVLEYIDWESCVISGSVMTACGMKRNPLMDICKTDNDMKIITDNDLSNFFFHYYADSDIDLICNKKSIYDFIDVVDSFVSKAKITNEKISVDNIHTGTMILSDEFILRELDKINKTIDKTIFNLKNSDTIELNFIKSNLSNLEIKKYFYTHYHLPWKKEQEEYLKKENKNTNNDLMQDYLNPIPQEEFRLYILDYELDDIKYVNQDYEKYFYSLTEPNLISAKLSETIRYKVSIPNSKTFEIFKSRNENFFSIVSKFHMGFVRAFWNGTTVKCLPSYISSMMLQFASDYKYFSSIRDPIEIVNKYRSRGFGIVLNNYEKLHMAYYNSSKIKDNNSNTKWIEMYKINVKSKQSVENIFGIKKSSDNIFKPSKYFIGVPDDCFKNINHDTLSSFDESFSSLITSSLFPLVKNKAIGDNGKINPLDRNIINLGWNLLNK